MRFALAVIVGILPLGGRMTVSAVEPLPTSDQKPAAELGKPTPVRATLELPRPLRPAPAQTGNPLIVRGASPDPLLGDYSPAARIDSTSRTSSAPAQLGQIRPAGSSSSMDPIDTPEQRYDVGEPISLYPNQTKPPASSSSEKFCERFHDWFDNLGKRSNGSFPESDHCFDSFISPLTSPFYAEDPRSLTELRPLFVYQTIPASQTNFRGGNINEFVLQGRLAITDQFSLVLHRLGVINLNTGSGAPIEGGTGITEIDLGPKFTFYRNEQSGTIAAAGLQFQIPVGENKVFQNTGSLSLVPYASFAKKFWLTSFGEMAFMSTLAYSASTTPERSDFFFANLHLDYDIAKLGKFYPTLEMNWYHYTTNGQANNIGVEGHDLMNIGAAVQGRDFVSIAPGFRWKITERWQTGIYTEFPLLGTQDLHLFRIGMDVIWRY